MIDANGWLDWAGWITGVPDKVYSQPNAGYGIVCHSIEGDLGTATVPYRFLSADRDAGGRYTPAAAASCMFINRKDGRFIQMYPVTASTWTSGNYIANTTLWAVESEGVAGEPLNDAQLRNMLRLAAEWEAHTGGKAAREGQRTVWQHNEVWAWGSPNAGPTACPSGRYDNFFAALEEEVTQTEYEDLLLSVWGAAGEQGLERAERIKAATYRRDQANTDGGEVQPLAGQVAEHIAKHTAPATASQIAFFGALTPDQVTAVREAIEAVLRRKMA